MPFFKIEKKKDYKIIFFCGFSIKIPRKNYKATFRPFKKLKSNTVLKENGFSIMGDFDSVSGESVAVRYFIAVLKKSGIPFECVPLTGTQLPQYKNKITFSPNPYFKPKEYNNITGMFWEYEDGMVEVRPYAFDGVSSIISFSHFNESYFRKIAPAGVNVYHLPFIPDIDFDHLEDIKIVREKYGIPENAFVCYFNFSYHSSYYRKNPEAVLKAFAKAFPDCGTEARLILKTVGSDDPHKLSLVQSLEREIENLNMSGKVIIINDKLSDLENYSLINSCDVYISLHRGEGIGLGMLEAMKLGKPVIATNYGGNTDFVNHGSAFPVGYKIIKPESFDTPSYFFVSRCAEPNVEEAAKHIRNLYEDKNMRINIAMKAKSYLDSYCSLEQYKKVLNDLLRH